jgi:hypothetical protein
MKNISATGTSVIVTHGICDRALARLLTCAALLGIVASANADQLQVTAANSRGDSVYDLVISPSSTTPIAPVIANATTLINNAKDEATHGGFDALVWVPNTVCKTLDLVVADATKGQIVRYQGASTLASCYEPTNGTPTVNPTAQIIFKWSKLGSGPAQPNGVSADANGNVFVVSSSGLFDPKPSVWVLPFNSTANEYCSAAAGSYCAPVLIDNKFSGTLTLALAETLVANASAVTSTGTVLWKAGDLLVLVGDSFDARLIVYSGGKIYGSNGRLATSGLPLSGPTSTAIPWVKFLAELAAPFGMDLWPANTSLGADAGVLFTTIDGRILRFDTVENKFVTDFADRLGLGLQKLKVATYANVPYAFVAQLAVNGTGQILAFAAPPATGTNKPLAAVSKGVANPVGLAVSNSGVQSLPTVTTGSPCVPPNPACTFAPLGPELVTVIQGGQGDNLSGTVQEQTCSVQSDPRVTTTDGWSCSQAALPIGAGTIYCPTFPSAVIPGSVCGHSGPTGSGFAVVEATATGIDPNDNNSFVTTVGNIDAVMPGASNLECANFTLGQIPGQIPLIAWGTRSDLTTVEGTIPEDSMFGPAFGGQAGFLTELTSTCDASTSSSRGISIFAIGLGLSTTSSQGYVYTLQNEKYEALQQTVTNANDAAVQTTLANDITTAENYVTAAEAGNFTSNINCALNEIAATDSYLRSNLAAFSSNLVTTGAGGGNPNPAGDIDGRLANWYTTLNTLLAGNAPYTTWPIPAGSVPVCAPASTQPQITSFTAPASPANDNVVADWTTLNTTTCSAAPSNTTAPCGCTLTSLYAFNFGTGYYPYSPAGLPTGAPGQTPYAGDDIYYIIPGTEGEQTYAPPYATPGWGSDTYTLTCYGPAGSTPATESVLNTSGFTPTTPTTTPLVITSFVTDPPGGATGYVGWTTVNSTASTVCTITDEFGGTPYNQAPSENLPANMGLPETSENSYLYPNAFGDAFCPNSSSVPPQNTDTITLTCSDPTNGTAMSSLTLSSTGCSG